MTMGWFDTSEVDAFAKWVVSEVVQRMPPDSLGTADQKLADRIHRMNEFVSGRATAMAAEKQLNFYKRARLANQVKWGAARGRLHEGLCRHLRLRARHPDHGQRPETPQALSRCCAAC